MTAPAVPPYFCSDCRFFWWRVVILKTTGEEVTRMAYCSLNHEMRPCADRLEEAPNYRKTGGPRFRCGKWTPEAWSKRIQLAEAGKLINRATVLKEQQADGSFTVVEQPEPEPNAKPVGLSDMLADFKGEIND